MASILALGPCCDAILTALRNSSALTARVSDRVYPNPSSRVPIPQNPVYPYVLVESAGELPFNTMGNPTGTKYGGEVTIDVRVASQFRSETEVQQIVSIVKQALDGQPLTVTGYPHDSIPEWLGVVPLTDTVAGTVTREWVCQFFILVHQQP